MYSSANACRCFMFGLTQKGGTMEYWRSLGSITHKVLASLSTAQIKIPQLWNEKVQNRQWANGIYVDMTKENEGNCQSSTGQYLHYTWLCFGVHCYKHIQYHCQDLGRTREDSHPGQLWYIRAKKVTSGYSFATPRAFIVTVILQYTVQNHYSCIQFALTRILCSEKHLFLFL